MLPYSTPFATNLTTETLDTLKLGLLEYRFGQNLIYQHPAGIVNTLFRTVSVVTPTYIVNSVSTKE